MAVLLSGIIDALSLWRMGLSLRIEVYGVERECGMLARQVRTLGGGPAVSAPRASLPLTAVSSPFPAA